MSGNPGAWVQTPAGPVRAPVDQITSVYVLSDMQEEVGVPQAIRGVDPDDAEYDGRDGTSKLAPFRTLWGVERFYGDHAAHGSRIYTYVSGAINPATSSLASLVGGINDPWDGVQYADRGAIIFHRHLKFYGSEPWRVTNPVFGPRQMRRLKGPYTSTYGEDVGIVNGGRIKIYLTGPNIGTMQGPTHWLRQTRSDGREVHAPWPITNLYPNVNGNPNLQAAEVSNVGDAATWVYRLNQGGADQFNVVTPACLIVINDGPQNTPTPNDAGLLIDVSGITEAGGRSVSGATPVVDPFVVPHVERLAFLSASIRGPLVSDNCLFRGSTVHQGGAMRQHNNVYGGDVRMLGDGCPATADSSGAIGNEKACRPLVESADPTVSDPAYPLWGCDFHANAQFSIGGNGRVPASLIVRKGISIRHLATNGAFSGLMVHDGCLLYQIGGRIFLESSGECAIWNKGGAVRFAVSQQYGHPAFIGSVQGIRNGFQPSITLAEFIAGPRKLYDVDTGSRVWDYLTVEPSGY